MALLSVIRFAVWSVAHGALLLTIVACGESSSDELLEVSRSAVTGGLPSGTDDDGVVQVRMTVDGAVKSCTGIMVAADLVLTARHCISYYEDGQFDCSVDGQLQGSVNGAGVMNAMFAATTISVCPRADCLATAPSDEGTVAVGKQVFGLPTPSICQNDIALVWLDRTVDVPIVPIRLDTATRPGETIRAVGYGEDSNGIRGIRSFRSGVPVISVAASLLLPEGGPVPRGTFVVGPGPCQGDSGGPALSEPSDPAQRGAVLGVFSIIGYPCGGSSTRNYYTQVAVFRDFVLNAFQTAGREPVLEVRSDAGGAGGVGGAAGMANVGTAGDGDTGGAYAVGGTGNVAGAGVGDSGGSGGEESHIDRSRLGRNVGCICRAAGGTAGGGLSGLPLLGAIALVLRRGRRNRLSVSQ